MQQKQMKTKEPTDPELINFQFSVKIFIIANSIELLAVTCNSIASFIIIFFTHAISIHPRRAGKCAILNTEYFAVRTSVHLS